MQKKFDVAVIGAGLCGIRSAQLVAAQDKSVAVFEAATEPGGVLKSIKTPNNAVVEEYYHHLFPSDKLSLAVIAGFGLASKLEWWNARSAFLLENELYELSTPTDLIHFKPLSRLERAVLAAFLLRVKLANPAKYDNVNAVEWIRSRAGESVYNKFFAPLLRSKFGDAAPKISAAWFIERMKTRSKRGIKGEKLGYLRGGFHQLLQAIKRNAEARGAQLHYNSPLKKITRNPDGSFTVTAGRQAVKADKVISTIPP
ncbi:MAG: FAD-dependent oxidoreductase, partial [Candidatus Norongarragalinales archaeon]